MSEIMGKNLLDEKAQGSTMKPCMGEAARKTWPPGTGLKPACLEVVTLALKLEAKATFQHQATAPKERAK